jgi:hypothetical protein
MAVPLSRGTPLDDQPAALALERRELRQERERRGRRSASSLADSPRVCTGSVVRQTPGGVRSTIVAGLSVPSGLAATDDDLWVTDWASGIVWRIVTDGTPTMVPVKTGLANPEGIAVDHDGSLLVVESGAGRLIRILPTGKTAVLADGLALGTPGGSGTTPAYAFNGVAVGPSGAIYVTGDRASVVWRFEERPR